VSGHYKRIKVKNHPYADKKGMYPLHRYVVEQYLGRYLKPTEVVHHINENKSDNRIENLIVFESAEAHLGYHKRCYGKKRVSSRYKKTVINCFYRKPYIGYGIVLYGPSCLNKKKKRVRELAEMTKRDLGLIT